MEEGGWGCIHAWQAKNTVAVRMDVAGYYTKEPLIKVVGVADGQDRLIIIFFIYYDEM